MTAVEEEVAKRTTDVPRYVAEHSYEFPAEVAEALYARGYALKMVVSSAGDNEYIFEWADDD